MLLKVRNGLYSQQAYFCPDAWCENFVVGDAQGGNGLSFVSAQDPRVPVIGVGISLSMAPDSAFFTTKYSDVTSPIVLASGIEARLIEAEAAINAGDPSWFATLNTLRATMVTPAMAAIPSMPTTTNAQIDLLYGERAYWLYLTGRRLGDLRRLIRNYGRDPETVFPTGAYPLGGVYKGATSIPFIFATEQPQNPHLTSGCTTR